MVGGGDDGWAPLVSEGGRAGPPIGGCPRGRPRERGRREGKGEIGEMGRLWAQRGRERFLGFFFFRKTIKLCLMLDNYYLCSKNSTKI